MKLTDTELNKTYIVTDISHDKGLLRRILDIGIIKGAKIERLFCSPFGDPTAYCIKNSVIALRRTESDKIFVEQWHGGDKLGSNL